MATKNNRDEKVLWTIVRVVIAAICLLILSGWFVKIEDVNDLLYDNLHSGGTVRRIIGTIIFCIGALGFCGIVDLFNLVNDFRAKHGAVRDMAEMRVIGLHALVIIIGGALMLV